MSIKKQIAAAGKRATSESVTSNDRHGSGGLAQWLSSPTHASLIVFLLSILLYANTIGHDFVWDDHILIVDNHDLQNSDASGVGRIFTEGLFGADQRGGRYYRPLIVLSYFVDNKLFGGTPGGFHATNVIWNALACVMAFLFMHRLFRTIGLSLISALIFATNPLHTESVAWISGRTDVFAAFWSFLSLICYVDWRRHGKIPMLLASLGGFGLALLSKESAVCLPALIVLLETAPFRSFLFASPQDLKNPPASRIRIRRGAVSLVLFFAVLLIYIFVRRAILGSITTYERTIPGLLGHLGLPLSIFGGYALKILFPFNLNAEYDAPVPAAFFDAHVMGGLIAGLLLLWSLLRFRRRPDVVLGIGIFAFGLAPALNIVPIAEISAERFLYLPSLGPALVFGGLLASALAIRNRGSSFSKGLTAALAWRMPPSLAGMAAPALLIVLVAFSGRTLLRTMDWKNEAVLFAKTIDQQPNNARAQASFAAAAYRSGDVRAAMDSYRKALALNPDYSFALSGLAGIYAEAGRFQDALPLIERAVRVAPDNAQFASNLGSVYFEVERYEDAAEQFEKAIRLDPNEFRARFNLGLVRLEQGDLASAQSHLQESLKGGPHFNIANFHLAKLAKAAGDGKQAEEYARRFLASHQENDALRREAELLLKGGK